MTIYGGFSPLKMVIFHSYVSLPGGTPNENGVSKWIPMDSLFNFGR